MQNKIYALRLATVVKNLLVMVLAMLSTLPVSAEETMGEQQFRLGASHLTGPSYLQKPEAAVLAWTRAAAEDHPAATYNLAQMYLVGEGVNKDPEYARRLFTKADSLGVSQAKQALAKLGVVEQGRPTTNQRLGSKAIFVSQGERSWSCGKLLVDDEEARLWSEDNYAKPYLLQLFASKTCDQAAKYVGGLGGLEGAKIFLKTVKGQDVYAVMVGSFKSRGDAKDYAKRNNFANAWVQSIFSLIKKDR